MRTQEPARLPSEQRALHWGPWWWPGAVGTLTGLFLWSWTAHLREQDILNSLDLACWILGGVAVVGGWAGAGVLRLHRKSHARGLEGRDAPASLWLLDQSLVADMAIEGLLAQDSCLRGDNRHVATPDEDGCVWRGEQRLRVRVLRRPGTVSLWTVEACWQAARRAGNSGLILVALGHFGVGAEDYARARDIRLVWGPGLLALVCNHPQWLAMAEAKLRMRTLLADHSLDRACELFMADTPTRVQALAALGLVLGTIDPPQTPETGCLERLAGGLGTRSTLETQIRLLRVALCQACHDTSGRGVAWVGTLAQGRADLVVGALQDRGWLVAWLGEQPGTDVWKILVPYWEHLAQRLPRVDACGDRAQQEAPLVVLAKLWQAGARGTPVGDTACEDIERAWRTLGEFRVWPATGIWIEEIVREGYKLRDRLRIGP